MKNLISVFAMLFLFVQVASAQLTKKGGSMVMERSESMSLGSNNALIVKFGEVDSKLVGQVWEKYVNDYYNGKTEWQRKQKEFFTDNINIPAIGGATPVDLHAKVEGKTDATFMLWINMGNSFLNSRDFPEQYAEAEKVVDGFVVAVQKEKTRLELEDQEKELKKLEKELEKLISANERYHKDIEKAKEAIKKAEEGIVENEREQELTRQKIESQKQTVEVVKTKLDNIN